MKGLHYVTYTLLVVGGLNWLLVGLIGWDIGALFGGMDAVVSRIIYILIGVSAVVEIVTHKSCCRGCGKGAAASSAPVPGQGTGTT
ncbi:MAG: DUF378 domain-containing protein [Patescibacteria group bacterium]|nr:DUF378 domain-containing protein [Patescibacteria group bacterium]